MINIYYINLDRSKNRRNFMDSRYNNSIRISGYDGDLLNTYTDIKLPSICNEDKYQLGCSLSHLKAIFQAYKNGDDSAIILEDDIDNKYKKKWTKSLDEIIKNAPIDAECVKLFNNNINVVNNFLKLKEDYCPWNRYHWSTGCYYINRKGMEKLYNMFYKNNIIDISQNLINYVADYGIIYNNLVTYNYTKPLFCIKKYKSLIQKTCINTNDFCILNHTIKTFFNNLRHKSKKKKKPRIAKHKKITKKKDI